MTTKELGYLNDALRSEQVIIKKYQEYHDIVQDQQLKEVCYDMMQKHKNHYNQLIEQLNS